MALVEVFVFLVFSALVWYSNRDRVGALLQSPSPEPLISYYENRFRNVRMADADAVLAVAKSLAYTVYGDLDAAKTEINGIDWSEKPPLIEAQRILVRAWWAYLDGDVQTGLTRAREARRLAEVSSRLPGSARMARFYDASIEAGELLSGNTGENVVASLEQKVRQLPIMHRLFVAWALETYYARSGAPAQASRMRELQMKLAPHGRLTNS
jgi:hypothetical protein